MNEIKVTGRILPISESTKRRNPELFRNQPSATTGKFEPIWTPQEESTLRNYYQTHTTRDAFSLDELAETMGRTRWSVGLKASRLGLGTQFRVSGHVTKKQKKAQRSAEIKAMSPEARFKELSDRRKVALAKYGHPRGMLGKKHSQELRDAISKLHTGKKIPREQVERMLKTKVAKYGTVAGRHGRVSASWKCHWVELGGQRFYARSLWEANYARYLEWLKINNQIVGWCHEPETFWFAGVRRGCVSYLPDFKITTKSGLIEYHEVKGWMDAASATKIRRMAKYHPEITLIVIDSKRYRALQRTCKNIIPQWGTIEGVTPKCHSL